MLGAHYFQPQHLVDAAPSSCRPFHTRPASMLAAPFRQRVRAAGRTLAYPASTCCLIQSVVTDLGRVIGVPIARLSTNWAHRPIAREAPNRAV